MRKLTRFTLYQNTPFTDFQNTVNYGSDRIRDSFFDRHFNQKTSEADFNFIRDRLNLRLPAHFADWNFLAEVNYLRFESGFETVKYYYCMVVNTRYENNGVTTLELVLDGLMTFCQGDISKYAKNVQIDRQHLSDPKYKANRKYLRTNKDILDIGALEYRHQDAYQFKDLGVIIRSSVDLAQDFGNDDDPKMQTSVGIQHDGIVSPQNLYYVEYTEFTNLTSTLQKYPWISQNLTKVIIIPKAFIDSGDLVNIPMNTGSFKKLYAFKDGTNTKNLGKIDSLKRSTGEMSDALGYEMEQTIELFRKPYTSVEMTNYQGQIIDIDPAYLPDSGLEIFGQTTIGFDNEAYFYPYNYKQEGENQIGAVTPGTYIHNAMVFNQWDDVPMLIDNYSLSKAQNANQRALAENNLVSGQAGNVVDNKKDLQTRIMSAINLSSNLSISGIGSKMVDEWQFYRKQKAEFADKKISAPTITDMTNTNSFMIKQQTFGVYIKYARIDDESLKSVKRYHKHFGYDWNRVDDLEPTDTMFYCNYAKFSGNWVIDDKHVPQSIMEQIRIQFENGVKMWHNPEDVTNPFRQDITDKNARLK